MTGQNGRQIIRLNSSKIISRSPKKAIRRGTLPGPLAGAASKRLTRSLSINCLPPLPQLAADAPQELGHLEGFDDEILGAGPHTFAHRLGISLDGQHDGGREQRHGCLEVRQNLKTRQFWHVVVQNDQVEGVIPG